MSLSLSAERDRIQKQVDQLEQSLSVTQNELDLMSSETDDDSDSEEEQDKLGQCATDLLAQREKIHQEIQNLEDMLGPHSPISVSSNESSSSSDESDLGLSESVDSCLQLNLVYQQVIQETLDHLETLLTHNQRQQREIMGQISGPVKEPSRDRPTSSLQHPTRMFLGSFLKPYFKDRLTGLGPPANQETKLKALRMAGCPDDKKLRMKRWESWQKTLLIHSVARDGLKRLIQPKLSRVDYLTQKMSSACEADKQQLREQIDGLEKEIEELRLKKEEELIGDRLEEHDWQKISNIDFEGTKDAEDIRLFWQNFLHPSINKTAWNQEEVQQLREVSRRHGERHWETIAEQLGTGRTAFMCLQMFQRFVSDSLRHRSWTPGEDAQLRELVDRMRIGNFVPYTQISYFMEGRDPPQLIYRWNQVLDPNLKKGPWTREEDQLLLRAVSRYGERCWWRIRLEVPGRTDGSCRDRYLDCLRKGLKRGPFDKDERELLKNLVEKHGVGRWSKIAAEIPHRFDAQCMREWRKLSRPSDQTRGKTSRRGGGGGGKKRKKVSATARRRVRRRVLKIKEEDEEMTEEEDDMVVPYMDSDEDTKKKGKRVKTVEEEEEEEEEEEYVIPPMKEWLPAKKTRAVSSLKFHPAVLLHQQSSSSNMEEGKLTRSTLVDKSTVSVIFGPPPRELRWEERHSSAALMMVSRDQLRAHLSLMEQKSNPPRLKGGPLTPQTQVTDRRTNYELQVAVTPWIGNLLIDRKRPRTTTDVLRERTERSGVSTSSIFLLLLQAMNVDVIGCREMIEQKKKVVQAPPPTLSPFRKKDPRSVAGLLQEKRTNNQQKEEEQRKLIVQQLQEVQQEQRRPQLLFQVSSHMTPQVFPQPVLLTHPVSQPIQSAPPPAGAPPFSLVSVLPNFTPTIVPLAPPPSPAVSSGSTLTSSYAAPPTSSTPTDGSSSTQSPPPGGEQRGEESLCCNQRRESGKGDGVRKEDVLLEAQPRAMMASSSSETDLTQKTKGQTVTCVAASSHLVSDMSSTPQTSSHQAASSAGSLRLAPPTSTVTSEPQSFSAALPYTDHNYTAHTTGHTPKDPDSSPKKTLKQKSGGSKRRQEEEQQQQEGRGCAGVPQREKRLRKPSLKSREAQMAQTEVKRKTNSASSHQQRRSGGPLSTEAVGVQAPPQPQSTGLGLLPSQTMWVMTPAGIVPLAPPQNMQLVFIPSSPHPAPQAPPPVTSRDLKFIGLKPVAASKKPPVLNHPCLLPAPPTCDFPPTLVLSRDPSARSSHPPAPHKGVVRVEQVKAPPLRKEGLQFNPALMFLEPLEEVRKWLSGQGGVAVPGARSALPYLPPFVSSLSTLSVLLQAHKSLLKSSLQLLRGANYPQHSQTDSGSAHCAPDLPDSTSDLRPAKDQQAAPSNQQQDEGEEEEQAKVVRQMVAERFSSNPAYQLLKARFLSCFTVPALLATIQPVKVEKLSHPSSQEEEEGEEGEEEEGEEQLEKIQERERQRKAERSLLLSEDSAAPASHFSGISSIIRTTTDPERVPQNQPEENKLCLTITEQNQLDKAGPDQTVTEL